MIHDSLFSPPQSPCFVLLKVLVSPSSKSLFRPGQSPVFLPPQSPWFLLLKVTCPSSPIPVSSSPSSFVLLQVLSPPPRFTFPSSPSPLPSSQSPLPSSSKPKKNSGTTRSRPAVRVVGSFQNGTYHVRKVCQIIH